MKKITNILFITSDQQRGDCYGFEGRRVKTPHLNDMARNGTRFQACITPNLVCQPSRASILTGLLPRTHGVSDNGIDLPTDVGEQGFAGAFSRAGYRTGLIGKAHFKSSQTFTPTGTPECRESTANYGADWYGPYMGFERVELMIEGHNQFPPMAPPHGQHYERWFHTDGRGEELLRLYKTAIPPLTDAHQTFNSGLPVAWHNSTWIGDRTIEFLRTNQNQPFCLWASFPDPHNAFDAPEPWCYMHHPDEVDIPQHRTRDFERRPWWHQAAIEGTPQLANEEMRLIRQTFSRTPEQSEGQLRRLIGNYYGMISLVDHQVGRIRLALRDLGLADNTLIVYSSDHGDWLGDHGLVLKGPMAYEGLLRVGLLFEGPGIPAGKVVQDPVSTLDLPQTFCDYAGVSLSHAVHSRSLRPLLETDGASRDFAYSEWDLRPSRTGVELQLRTVRTRRHKLTLDLLSGAGELYDLQEDPHEMQNRFGDAHYKSVQRELTDMIASRPADACTPLEALGIA